MPDLDFSALRAQLEEDVDQPPFAVIRARRQRRSRRTAIAGAVAATLVVIAGAAVAGAPHRSRSVPIGPPSTGPSARPSDTFPRDGASATGMLALAAGPSGTLYAISNRCPADCATASSMVTTLSHSTDLGATWTPVARLDWVDERAGYPTLLVGDEAHLWVTSGTAAGSSADGGVHWQRADLGGGLTDGPLQEAVAGGTAWMGWAGRVRHATAGQIPVATAGQPPGTAVLTLAAVDAAHAMVLTADPPAWYATSDTGLHWTAMADPCAGTRLAGSRYATVTIGPDGTRWVVCTEQPGVGQQGKDLVTSTDGGRTWQHRSVLEAAGEGDQIAPVSATAAWRTGSRADIYRTTDGGAHWSDVAATGGPGGPAGFAAVDADTAVYIGYADDGTLTVYLTRDGGHTWTGHPFTT